MHVLLERMHALASATHDASDAHDASGIVLAETLRGMRTVLDELSTHVRTERETRSDDTPRLSARELLCALVAGRDDFVVRAATASEQAFFQLREGRLVDAVSSKSPVGQRLGEILVDLRLLGADELESEMARVKPGMRIGDALLASGRISALQLEVALAEQRRRLLARLAADANLQLSISRT
ncbi:MAG: hypothetical protein L6Q99_04070 [Planctomycetes bacterium]|nr:hypothetical protein [Planctomycetota bacterium]